MKTFLLTLSLLSLSQSHAQIRAFVTAFERAPICSGTFVRHELPHVTKAFSQEVTFYDSNGSGVAINDLNEDGYLDIVLATLAGENTVLWNEGNLTFRKETLPFGASRSVNIVDINGDGWQDIVFTQNTGAPHAVLNNNGQLKESSLKGIFTPAYAQLWADFDADGDLDVITGSYDALLEKELKNTFLFSSGAGVRAYMQTTNGFEMTRLTNKSQTLALELFDVDGDGQDDVIVGNDFALPDEVFTYQQGVWRQSEGFSSMTRNTMSFAVTHVNNGASLALFATDMKPDFRDVMSVAAWTPLMEQSYQRKLAFDSQKEENMLQQRQGAVFRNTAYQMGLDATGWSWSASFGDLDQNGYEDLYVVNGMIAKDVFSHLPNNELVERNQVFRYTPERGYQPADWGLDATASGRGMSMADLDNDGDLDIVINNLQSPSVIFENQLCQGRSLKVDLSWQNHPNSAAIGASVRLHSVQTDGTPLTMYRQVRTSSGYLSGTPKQLHFGIPDNAIPTELSITWPDGLEFVLPVVEGNQLVKVVRDGR